jgi:hypothetical protein
MTAPWILRLFPAALGQRRHTLPVRESPRAAAVPQRIDIRFRAVFCLTGGKTAYMMVAMRGGGDRRRSAR